MVWASKKGNDGRKVCPLGCLHIGHNLRKKKKSIFARKEKDMGKKREILSPNNGEITYLERDQGGDLQIETSGRDDG